MIYDVIPQLEPNGYTVAEFFAGGGLMGMGVKRSGCNIIWANDFDPKQAANKPQSQVIAYRHNVGHHILQKDVTKIKAANIPQADIFVGGPPCQDYSIAGEGAGEEGKRGSLVWRYLAIIKLKQPKAFLFENVKGLIMKKHMHTFQKLLQRFDRIGYTVSWQLVNSWDYGVAQKRERVFIVGIRKDIGIRYKFPDPTAEEYRTQVLRDVIGDLPDPGVKNNVPLTLEDMRAAYPERGPSYPGMYEQEEAAASLEPTFYTHRTRGRKAVYGMDEAAPTIKTFQRDMPPSYEPHPADAHVQNHDPKELSDKALDYLNRDPRHLQKHRPPTMDEAAPTLPAVLHKGVPYGLHYPDNHTGAVPMTAYRGHEPSSMDQPAKTVVAGAHGVPGGANCVIPDNHTERHYWTPPVGSEYTYGQANRVQDMEQPSNTIPAHHNSGQPIHPISKPRRFTVRECLRIQSVPDSYVLPDSISLSAQYRIVGNGVASKVAYDLMRALVDQLNGANPVKLGQGDLFDFI